MKRVLATIMRLLNTLVPAMRWCGRTSAWVVDKTVRGTLLGAATVIETTANATAAGLEWTGDILGKTASIPGKVIGGLFSGGGGNIPVPSPGADAAEHDRRMRAVESAAFATRKSQPLLTKPKPGVAAPSAVIGEIVHSYAGADPHARLAIDLDLLPPYIRTWLVSRSEKELERLAAVGPTACSDVASGRRRIVGVERPDAIVEAERVLVDSSSAPYLTNASETDKDAALTSMSYVDVVVERIARAKGGERPYVPYA